ncbi:MAG: DinB family protein [Planctomycetes bacterium]|nr:DinB family protein [Planctomycetota bacterium]
MASTKNPVVDTLLCLLDQCYDTKAWHGPHVRASIRGVDTKEAAWRPQPKRKNVAQQVLHIAYWKYVVRRKLRGDKRGSFPFKGTNWFPVPPRLSEAHWEGYKQILEDQHAQLRQTVVGLAKTGRWSVSPEKVHLISGIAAHDVYHAGQIRLLRSMYESKKK